MRKICLLLSCFLLALAVHSQETPKIGSTKGLKEKFLLIKKALPYIKKNLTKPDPMWTDARNVIFEMGNGDVLFDEDKESEILTISFSSGPYFSGTLDDFKNFYAKLVGIITEVFASSHAPKTESKGKTMETNFYEKNKDLLSSKSYILVELSWILDDPDITVTVVRNKTLK